MVIEIRRARSDRNAAEFYGYPYFTFYLKEIFCTHKNNNNKGKIISTAQKSKETRRMEMGSVFVLYIQPTIPTYTWVASDYSVVMYVYVGIVGWIYRTKTDPISILLVSLLF